jgi:hypothetical protein
MNSPVYTFWSDTIISHTFATEMSVKCLPTSVAKSKSVHSYCQCQIRMYYCVHAEK